MNTNLRWIGRILLFAATLIATYLTWNTIQGDEVPGCGQGDSCGTVLSSQWSSLAGIPIGAFGAVLYLLLIIISFTSSLRNTILTALTSLTIMAAIWFIIVQAFILHLFCPWCCAIHIAASIGALFIWFSYKKSPKPAQTKIATKLATIMLPALLVTGMAYWQSNSAEPEKINQASLPQNGISIDSHKLYLYGQSVIVDQDRLPNIGTSPDAPLAVLVSDFSCPYCLALHHKLKLLEKQDPGMLRTIILPGFHDSGAREIHKLMLVIWRANPQLYESITELLIDGSLPPDSKAIRYMIKLKHTGDFSLDLKTYGRWASSMLEAGKDLMLLNGEILGTRKLPQLMIGENILTGNPSLTTLRNKAETTASTKINKQPVTKSNIKPGKDWKPALSQGFQYDTETLDLGRPQRGKEFIGTFHFKNTTSEPLTIDKVSASCGCATTKINTKTILPGEKGNFQVTIDSSSLQGPFKNTLTIRHSNSKWPHKVQLIADIWSPLAAYPNGLFFGNIIIGKKPAPLTSKLIALEGKPIKILSVECDDPAFVATITPLATGGRQYQLSLNLAEPSSKTTPRTPIRNIRSSIKIAIDNPRHPIFSIPIRASFVTAVEASPQEIHISKTQPNTNKTIIIKCHDTQAKDFKITKLSLVTDSETQELASEKTTIRSRIHLKFNLPETLITTLKKHPSNPHLLLETNYPGFHQIKIPISPKP